MKTTVRTVYDTGGSSSNRSLIFGWDEGFVGIIEKGPSNELGKNEYKLVNIKGECIAKSHSFDHMRDELLPKHSKELQSALIKEADRRMNLKEKISEMMEKKKIAREKGKDTGRSL